MKPKGTATRRAHTRGRAALTRPLRRAAKQSSQTLPRVPPTPLSQKLQAPAKATPQDLFQLALTKWNEGERFDIGKMAEALRVSRATVFRWVGSRELLYGEVLSHLFQFALQDAMAQARGTGPDYVAEVSRRLMTTLLEHAPLRRFVQQDSEYAMRVLMSKSSTVEQRSAEAVRRALEAQQSAGHIRPAMRLGDLAYLIVRIGESFLYRDAITGEPPEVEAAVRAIRTLVAAEDPA